MTSMMVLALTPSGEDASVYGPGKENFSPMNSFPAVLQEGYPLPVVTNQTPNTVTPARAGNYDYVPTIPPPPDPSIGGQHGPTGQLGWTTGIRPYRWGKQLFTGITLRGVPNQANPKTGNVGFSNESGKRAAGVAALLTDYTPTNEAVSMAFAGSVKPNAITDEVQAIR